MDYEYVLNSNNPDNKLEYFWLTFKNSILEYLDDSEKEEIKLLSNKLNRLQKQEKYDKIEVYIKSHIEKIGYSMILMDDCYRAGHLDTNIKRWNKLVDEDLYPENNTFINVFMIYINSQKKKKTKGDERYTVLLNALKQFSSNPTDHQELINLMNVSIVHKFYGNIDKLRNVLDINHFINPKNKDSLTENFIKNTKGKKICQYMIPLEID